MPKIMFELTFTVRSDTRLLVRVRREINFRHIFRYPRTTFGIIEGENLDPARNESHTRYHVRADIQSQGQIQVQSHTYNQV